jgi:hypothetical protein
MSRLSGFMKESFKMTRWILAAGAAALAIAAPAVADPKGGGHGKGGQQAAHAKGGDHGEQAKVNRGGGDEHRGHDMRAARQQPSFQSERRAEKGFAKADKQAAKSFAKAERREVERDSIDRDEGRRNFAGARFEGRGLIEGCPPGLQAKNNGCLPPGQAKKLVGAMVPASALASQLDGPYRDWFRDDDRHMYRMGDGYLYQVDRQSNLVDALIPYGMGDYAYYPVGYTYPQAFNYYNVPTQYRSYYPDGSDAYRYGGNAIYQVNPQTSLVSSIVQLLAGDLSVGQRLPASYGAYNLPMQYRDQYADSATDLYRYNDGYIYRADPTTQLITAVISAIV